MIESFGGKIEREDRIVKVGKEIVDKYVDDLVAKEKSVTELDLNTEENEETGMFNLGIEVGPRDNPNRTGIALNDAPLSKKQANAISDYFRQKMNTVMKERDSKEKTE